MATLKIEGAHPHENSVLEYALVVLAGAILALGGAALICAYFGLAVVGTPLATLLITFLMGAPMIGGILGNVIEPH